MEFPVELSCLAEDDLVELVWDKGEITMRNQSSRVRNSQNYVGKTAASTIGRFDSFVDDAPLAVPSGEADLSLVDDMVPWFDDFLPETSGVTMRDLPIHNSLTPPNKSRVQTLESLGNSSVFNNQRLVHTNDVDTHSSRTGTVSSVCSESSADKTSNCQMLNSKRKDRGSEKSDYQSEDVEEERVGVRKSAPARERAGLKRNRDTEVHNLSERRRRERINEKMRALQELMPNCNKVDKASMLDEVIEYLKTLQRQVQTMSMGAGVYMPQMMIPAAHVSHFASMGMGYGMAGMQMFNTNGSPMFPDPSIQRPHYASPLGSPNLGYPGQGLSISVPRAPLMTHVSTNSSVCVNATSLGSRVEVPSSFPTLNSMDRVPSNFKNDSRSQGIKSINSNPPSLQLNNGQELHRIDDGNVSLTNENVALVEKQVLPYPEGVEMIS